MRENNKILFIERNYRNATDEINSLRAFARKYNISLGENDITFLEDPPPNLQETLDAHTGAIIHNLTPRDLEFIGHYFDEHPQKSKSIIIVRTSATATDLELEYYGHLGEKGATIVKKPFSVLRNCYVIFGLEENPENY